MTYDAWRSAASPEPASHHHSWNNPYEFEKAFLGECDNCDENLANAIAAHIVCPKHPTAYFEPADAERPQDYCEECPAGKFPLEAI